MVSATVSLTAIDRRFMLIVCLCLLLVALSLIDNRKLVTQFASLERRTGAGEIE